MVNSEAPPSPAAILDNRVPASKMAPTSQQVTFNEERNILICGPKASGKTALAFTLARGIFPQAAGLPEGFPGRFEGWSIGACATPLSTLTATQSASSAYGGESPLSRSYPKHKSLRAGHPRGPAIMGQAPKGPGDTAANSKDKDPAMKPYFVNFTLWEDRPRLGLDAASGSKKNSTASNLSTSGNTESNESKDDAGSTGGEANGVAKYVGLVHDFRRKRHQHPSVDEQDSKNNNENGRDNSPSRTRVKPKRIWPVPEPHLLVVCYSAVDFESFREVEDTVVPEVTEAFPSAPLILVATKCDLKDNSPTSSLHEEGQDSISTAQEEDEEEAGDGVSGELHSVTSEMGRDLAHRIGARAFVECSAKEQRGLRHVLEEAVWISFDNWIQVQRSVQSPSSSGGQFQPNPNTPSASPRGLHSGAAAAVAKAEKVNRKWSLAATLSTSVLASSWPSTASWSTSTSAAASMTSLVSNDSSRSHGVSGAASYRAKPCETPRPAISIQDPFSSAFPSLPGFPGGSTFSLNKQRKQSYGVKQVKKIFKT